MVVALCADRCFQRLKSLLLLTYHDGDLFCWFAQSLLTFGVSADPCIRSAPLRSEVARKPDRQGTARRWIVIVTKDSNCSPLHCGLRTRWTRKDGSNRSEMNDSSDLQAALRLRFSMLHATSSLVIHIALYQFVQLPLVAFLDASPAPDTLLQLPDLPCDRQGEVLLPHPADANIKEGQ